MPAFSSDERQLLADSLREFLIDNYTFDHLIKLMRAEDGEGFGRSEWAQYAELGWLATAIPESADGVGGGITELGIVMAACGGHLLQEPLLQTLVLGASAIELAGTPAQQALLGEIAVGGHLMAFCHAEPDAGYARNFVQTTATPNGDNFVLNGQKGFALHANAADSLIVSARVGGGGTASGTTPLAMFLVPRETEGLGLAPAPSLDGRQGAALSLDNVKVPASARLGDGTADSLPIIDSILDRGAVAICAEAVGAMAAVTTQTVEYLKTREQFGQPLSRFQVLQHRLVDMSVAGEEARAVVHAALQAIDENRSDAQRLVWNAKV